MPIRVEKYNTTEAAGADWVSDSLPAFPTWQLLVIAGIVSWLFVAQRWSFTVHLRAVLQPFVLHHVDKGIAVVLQIQKWEHSLLDVLLASLASTVSVEFYTAFLPLLFWSGHTKLARQLTLLMALCIYIGNSVKDLVCAPRPPSPPVRRIVPMESEKESSLEYGLPSSHSINTLCLSGYLLHYLMGHKEEIGIVSISAIAALLSAIVFLVVFGRLYLGMHTPIDVAAGLALGALLLLGWCMVDDYVDAFITSGENVLWFWATIAILLLFAYPTPELRTPSFEFHTAFNGVVFGIVSAINRTYLEFHTDMIPIIPLSTWGGIIDLSRRLAIGLPIVLIVKVVSKALAIRVLPVVCNFVGFPIRSSHYVPTRISTTYAQCSTGSSKKMDVDHKQVHMSVILDDKASMDVDTGIRLVQYAGVGWAVAELTPYVFHYLAL